MMGALQMGMETRDMSSLSQRLQAIRSQGVSVSSIASATNVNRSLVSTLINRGAAGIGLEGIEALWAWVDAYESREEEQAVPDTLAGAPEGGYKRDLGIIETEDYKRALGYCSMIRGHQKIGIIQGMPGTGKTTIARKLQDLLPNTIYIEAWPFMRMGDLLDKIALGLGVQLRGSITQRTERLISMLKSSGATLIIDETEYLKKWNTDKLDVLRKLQDNTGVTLILMGTPAMMDIINRMHTTQLSSRMLEYKLTGPKAREIRAALNAYNIDPTAADALTAIATDREHGGLRSYTLMMELCLTAANGGRITMEILEDARQYKPGLR